MIAKGHRASIDDVPAGELRDRLGAGDRVLFAPAHEHRIGLAAFTIQWRGLAFVVHDAAGHHAGTFASWHATVDAALAIARRTDA